jgi:hypothetical protein
LQDLQEAGEAAMPWLSRLAGAAGGLWLGTRQTLQKAANDIVTAIGNTQYPSTTGPDMVPIYDAHEQGRDAQGKFLPKQPGESRPGSGDEAKGLDAAGATKNTKPIPGTTRIPDGKTADGQYVEVKSGGTVAGTKQVNEMAAGARAATGKPLVVQPTNPNVKVSKPVQQNPDIDLRKPLNR